MKLFFFILCISICQAEWPAHMDEFKETALPKEGPEAYRMILSPTFTKPFLFKLIVTDKNSGTFTVKRLSGKGGYDPGQLDLEQSFRIRGEEFQKLVKKLREPSVKTPFGKLNPEHARDILSGTDGSEVILEGIKDKTLFKIRTWTPEFLHRGFIILNLEKEKDFENFHQNFNPHFQACFALMKTASSRIAWSDEMERNYRQYAEASVIYGSPSFRAAIALLEGKEIEDARNDDPFSVGETIPASEDDHRAARKLLEKALQEIPDHGEIHSRLAYSYVESVGDFKRAIHHMTEAIKLDPGDDSLILTRGMYFAEAKLIEKAKRDLQTLNEMHSEHSKDLQKIISMKTK